MTILELSGRDSEITAWPSDINYLISRFASFSDMNVRPTRVTIPPRSRLVLIEATFQKTRHRRCHVSFCEDVLTTFLNT